jgi:hypothetical protein
MIASFTIIDMCRSSFERICTVPGVFPPTRDIYIIYSMVAIWWNTMTKINRARLSVMPTESRLKKLRAVALEREKSMTQMIEDWIDRLPPPKTEES